MRKEERRILNAAIMKNMSIAPPAKADASPRVAAGRIENRRAQATCSYGWSVFVRIQSTQKLNVP